MNLVELQSIKLIHKKFSLLHTNDEISESETNERISFTIISKRIKYLEINLPKETKDLYSENYMMLMKEIHRTKRDGKIYHALGFQVLVLSKLICYPKKSTSAMQFLSNYNGTFHRIRAKNI